ncbi:hypothetical protein NPIL_333061 [Nephila pilipes]|uniref:Uncharacterized protein n=1 Tax=Nephila pilipes TaxID=299642 RepID=A0A8X6NIX4_NEPPI|nr:hypothetical protein NPIL_333061 [Nephila pilipes]
MGTRKFFTLAELEDVVNEPNFFESDNDGATVDIDLFPDKVDIISDTEDLDENILEDSCPRDVASELEIHLSVLNIAFTNTDPNDNNVTRKCTKTKIYKKIIIGRVLKQIQTGKKKGTTS